jgi:hypothetical protein
VSKPTIPIFSEKRKEKREGVKGKGRVKEREFDRRLIRL